MGIKTLSTLSILLLGLGVSNCTRNTDVDRVSPGVDVERTTPPNVYQTDGTTGDDYQDTTRGTVPGAGTGSGTGIGTGTGTGMGTGTAPGVDSGVDGTGQTPGTGVRDGTTTDDMTAPAAPTY
jgi:hypothetical protein